MRFVLNKKTVLNFISRLVYGKSYTSESYIEKLRMGGGKIGKDVCIHSPTSVLIDDTQPWLLTIGNNVQITAGVKILTHDYSWYVLKNLSGYIYGANRPVKIGNNVFIGVNSVVLSGATIADNIVIGAGSIVSGKLEQSGVYAGIPARRIMSLDDYAKKRADSQLKEAKEMAIHYRERFNQDPPVEVFHEYFYLFSDMKQVEKVERFRKKIELGTGSELSREILENVKPTFDSYEDFLKYCFTESATGGKRSE